VAKPSPPLNPSEKICSGVEIEKQRNQKHYEQSRYVIENIEKPFFSERLSR
jgi:hypothetical protein